MRGIVVCVNYWDYLALTLERNARYFDRVLIVTDIYPFHSMRMPRNCRFHETDVFWRKGEQFNKGAAVEEGLDVLGRKGWICHFDADIAMPEKMPVQDCKIGRLYGARRRMCAHAGAWDRGEDWSGFPVNNEGEIPGFFQLFHADDPVLNRQPWYSLDWSHAGGYDTEFQNRWHKSLRVKLPFEVLHLGPTKTNWCGRVSPLISGRPAPGVMPEARMAMETIKREHERGNFEIGKIP